MRKLSCILIAILLCLVWVSCSMINKGDRIAALEENEYELWSPENRNPHEDSSAPGTFEVTFMGNVYKGTYVRSIVSYYNTYQTDVYRSDDGYFEVNHDTKELVGIFLLAPDWQVKYTQEYCRNVADKFAEKYINISEYKVEPSHGEYFDTYFYKRYIDGIKTCEVFSVTVWPATGEVGGFGSTMLGCFDDKDKSDILDAVNKIQSASSAELDKKIRSIYPNYTSYDIEDMVIVKLKNRKYGIVYEVSVKQPKSPLHMHNQKILLALQ